MLTCRLQHDARAGCETLRHDAVVKALSTLNELKSHVACKGESWLCAVAGGCEWGARLRLRRGRGVCRRCRRATEGCWRVGRDGREHTSSCASAHLEDTGVTGGFLIYRPPFLRKFACMSRCCLKRSIVIINNRALRMSR